MRVAEPHDELNRSHPVSLISPTFRESSRAVVSPSSAKHSHHPDELCAPNALHASRPPPSSRESPFVLSISTSRPILNDNACLVPSSVPASNASLTSFSSISADPDLASNMPDNRKLVR